jgi:predicted O-linked N-acetylglucosamine transferase (SPINDLY family)
MAGAMLTNAGLSELITYNLDDYEETAVRLAMDPQRTHDLRTHLASVRANGTLFDTPQFVRDLDALLVQLVRDLPLPELTAVNHG